MKNLKIQFLLIALFAFLITACGGAIENNISGTYVNHASGEFSVADDTLVVEHDKEVQYLIHRRTGFQLINEDGEKGKLQHEAEQWKAVYDEGSQSITEKRKGRIISFDVKKGSLVLENSVYQRIN